MGEDIAMVDIGVQPSDVESEEPSQEVKVLVISKYFNEFVGTFFFLFAISSAVAHPEKMSALAIGACLMVLVYMGGHTSSGHYNPAVTTAILLSGRNLISFGEAAIYIFCQCFGGLLGVLAGFAISGSHDAPRPEHLGRAFVAELIFTFFLTFTVLSVATTKKTAAYNGYFGLAIGFSVVTGVLAIAPISGGVMNPAIATALKLGDLAFHVDGNHGNHTGNDYVAHDHSEASSPLWLYWVSELLAAALAAAVYRLLNPEEYGREFKFAKPVMEFIGNFIFVCVIALCAGKFLGGLAIGGALMVLIYSGGHISGGHYNPAVTLGVLISGRNLITPALAVVFVISQCLGGMFGAAVGFWLRDTAFKAGVGVDIGVVFGAEVIFTTLLVLTVLNVATSKQTANNSYFGLAIGFVVVVGAISVGHLGSGVFNPAVATGLELGSLMHGFEAKSVLWMYWVAELLGGVLAAAIFYACNYGELSSWSAVPSSEVS